MTMTGLSYDPAGDVLAFQACRTLGHRWDDQPLPTPTDGSIPLPSRPAVLVRWRCERCTMERRDVTDPSGEVVARRYLPPVGYYHSGDHSDSPSPRRSDWRRSYLLALGVLSTTRRRSRRDS